MEIIKKFEKVNKVKVPYNFLSERTGDVPVNFADVSKAKSLLDWKAKKNVKQMLKSSWFYELNGHDN